MSVWKSYKWYCAIYIAKGDESLWKCQNLNDCPDVSGLCPSSVECSLWVTPRFLVLNLYIAYHDASKVVRSIPRCNMALKRSVSGNGTLAVKWYKGECQQNNARELRWFPSKRTRHRFPMKLGMPVLTGQGDIKNVITRGGHRACFHATMLTNTSI